jgi:general secretion pathway protein D
MRTAIAVLVIACLVSAVANADECVAAESDILKLINDVSSSTGRKFVVDPRVRAQVTLVGFKDGDVTYETLKSILEIHAFTALESNAEQVVYVVPSVIAEKMKGKLGIP